MSAATGTPADLDGPPITWPPQRGAGGPSGGLILTPDPITPQGPYDIVEALVEFIGTRRAAELVEIRQALSPAAGGGWGVLFLPPSTTREGRWVAMRGRTEFFSDANGYALRDRLLSEFRWWRYGVA